MRWVFFLLCITHHFNDFEKSDEINLNIHVPTFHLRYNRVLIKDNALMASNCFVPKQESVHGCQPNNLKACVPAIFWCCNVMTTWNHSKKFIWQFRKKKDNNIPYCSLFTIFNFYHTEQILNYIDNNKSHWFWVKVEWTNHFLTVILIRTALKTTICKINEDEQYVVYIHH